MTERLQFAGKFNYLQEDTFRWRTIDLIQTGSVNSPIDEPGADERGIESFLSERKSYTYFGSFSYQLNEISRMKAGYRYRKNDYDIEENKDFEVHDVNLDYIRNLAGQKDQIGTRVTYSHRTSEVSDTDTYGTGLLWNHLFTETINLYTNIGLRYTEEKSKDTGQKNDDWGVTADIRLRRLGETNVFNIGFAQNVQTASGGGAVNVPRLYWNLRQTLSERVLFGLDGDIYITTEDGDSLSDIETVSFNISPSLKYRLTENYSVRLGYDYLIDHDRSLEEDRDIERNRVWIAFELGFPNEW
jgi:long-subunit fatty acid transport protein